MRTFRKTTGRLSDNDKIRLLERIAKAIDNCDDANGALIVVTNGVTDPTFTTPQAASHAMYLKNPTACAFALVNHAIIIGDLKYAKDIAEHCMKIGMEAIRITDEELAKRAQAN